MSSAKRKGIVQFSDSSDSDTNNHEGGHSGLSMAKEMALAAKKLRETNPHTELGRATRPRANPLERRSAAPPPPPRVAGGGGAAAKAPQGSSPKVKKVDLFGDSSASSSAEDDDEDEDGGNRNGTAAVKRRTIGVASSGTKAEESEGGVDVSSNSGAVVKATKEEEEEESSDGADAIDASSGLRINKKYAQKFEEVKRKQELQRLTEKYSHKLESIKKKKKKKTRAGHTGEVDGDDDDDDDHDDEEGLGSSSSSDGEPEDDDAVLLTEENELAFAQALLAVRKAAAKADAAGGRASEDDDDEESYLKQRYFPPAEQQMQRNADIFEQAMAAKGKKKKFTLKEEYQRAVQATAVAKDDSDGEEGPSDNGSGLRRLRPQTAEERALRKAFLESVADSTEAFSVEKKQPTTPAGADAGSKQERARQMEEQRRQLMEEAFNRGSGGSSSKADEDEAFIRQFFLKDLWRGGGSGSDSDDDNDELGGGGGANYAKQLAELAQAEEDEAFYNDADVWEREFQEKKYRHEEEAEAARIQTFPRPIGEAAAGLLRKTSDTRKDARKRKRERLEAARQQQVEELKRLKHLKRQEIEEQRALIAAVAGIASRKQQQQQKKADGGNEEDDDNLEKPTWSDDDEDEAVKKLKAVWSEKDLDAPFDPEEFDKKMALLFDEDYYAPENVNEDEIAYMEAELDNVGDDGEEDDIPASAKKKKSRRGGTESEEDTDEEAHEDDDDGDASAGEEDSQEEGVDEDADASAATGPHEEKKRKSAARARFAALAEEPDLFKAASLEEAKRLAQRTKSTTRSGAAALRHDDDDEPFFSDPFGLNRHEDGTSAKSRKEGKTKGTNGSADNDDLALLYPSASLHHLEEAAFQHRQELDRLLAEKKKTHSSTSGGADADADAEADDDDEQSEEAVLKRLQAELKRKEEEYYQLHRQGGDGAAPFRYREVPPEDFTLTVEEILARDDRQLNMIAPMNCYSAYLDKEANERDRRRIERRRLKGFREIDAERRSRRYGEVAKTVLLNPDSMTEEEGAAVAHRLRKRLCEEGVEASPPTTARAPFRSDRAGADRRPHREPQHQHQHQQQPARGRGRGYGGDRGRGGSGFRGNDRGAGGFRGGRGRGRGSAPFVPRGGQGGSSRGGRGH